MAMKHAGDSEVELESPAQSKPGSDIQLDDEIKPAVFGRPALKDDEVEGDAAAGDARPHKASATRSRPTRLGAQHAIEDGDEEDDTLLDVTCPKSPTPIELGVTRQRWVQLALLSMLNLVSDWACFAFVAAPDAFLLALGHSAEDLIDLFLVTNVISCFLVTDVAKQFGLRRVVSYAGVLMAVGCALRSGVPFFGSLPEYKSIVLGTILIGAAQPFFQCTPPLLSQTWFANQERALATAVAINFNQVGIALAFLVGGGMQLKNADDIHRYLSLIAVVSVLVAALTLALFEDLPPLAPSASAAIARNAMRPRGCLSYPMTAWTLIFNTHGFLYPLVAFICSISVSNVVSALNSNEMARADVTETSGVTTANFVGALFQIAIVVGGIVFGGYVDRTKRFKSVTIALLTGSFIALALLGVAEGLDDTLSTPIVIFLMFLLGLMLGPVQPINAELAVEVAYPIDENAVEATQQLGGNLFSAILLPICVRSASDDIQVPRGIDYLAVYTRLPTDMMGDSAVLLVVVVVTLLYFTRFASVLRREEADHKRPSTERGRSGVC